MIYAVSDIHGCYAKYKKLMETIILEPEDTLYVLGDVIDYGPDGFKIMLDMAQRFNVVNLMGDHEAMAVHALPRVLDAIKQGQETALTTDDSDALELWLKNGGELSLADFLWLDNQQEKVVWEYMRRMPLYKELEVTGRKFVLLHGGLENFSPDRSLLDYAPREILWCRPEPNTVYYSTWPIHAYIVVSSEEYCDFLNGKVPVEIINIPNENGSDGDLGEKGRETNYSQYAGTWASNDVGWIYGGQILDIAVSGDTITATFEDIRSAPTSQVAEVSVTLPLSSINNGTVSTAFDDDYWGHSGMITLTFTENSIVCAIRDVEGGEPYASWGVSEGTYLLVRDDGAHEKMIYDMDVYYEMFPEDSPQQTPASNSTTASDILAGLGMTGVADFKLDCTPLNIMDLRTLREHPGDYANRHFTTWLSR